MKRFFTACLILLTLAMVAHSQVLKVKVTLDPSNLPADEVNNLSDFPDKVEQYFNAYEWVEDEYEYDVICKVRIIIQSVQQKSHEKLYLAQFVITSESGEYFYDKIWEFPYDQGTPFSHFKGQFDPLTHFLDFYAYMVLAGELDTNDYLKGNSLYEKARDIANRGQLSKYPRGWSSRMNMVLVITDARTRPLREVKPDFFEALYLLDEGKRGEAYNYAKKVLEGLKKVYKVQPNNLYLQYFFNSHYEDLAELFKGHNTDLELLAELDSRHRQAYRDVME
ncbi:MAG: DUF4835 family protein [Caldisericaceae bacterium]|nr:DUF4835 family protein [Caldisericaceae bacterium]